MDISHPTQSRNIAQLNLRKMLKYTLMFKLTQETLSFTAMFVKKRKNANSIIKTLNQKVKKFKIK